jgi:hypothetical protein
MKRTHDSARIVFIQLDMGAGGGYTAYIVLAHSPSEAVKRAETLMKEHKGHSMMNVYDMPFDFPRDELKAGTYRLAKVR